MGPHSRILLASISFEKKDWVSLKGTIGCFLSHVSAWEQIAVLKSPYAIVLEDDVDISSLKALHAFTPPDDAEIVFLNDRMSPATSNSDIVKPSAMWESFERLNKQRVRCRRRWISFDPRRSGKVAESMRDRSVFRPCRWETSPLCGVRG